LTKCVQSFEFLGKIKREEGAKEESIEMEFIKRWRSDRLRRRGKDVDGIWELGSSYCLYLTDCANSEKLINVMRMFHAALGGLEDWRKGAPRRLLYLTRGSILTYEIYIKIGRV
jgi:hypothetical protein